jgi:NAD(P)-dependent dehydrogenase (short-subunit alcohol dehydrogenase family)
MGLAPCAITVQRTGRVGTPTDIANLVRFLLSARGAWINGQLQRRPCPQRLWCRPQEKE